MLTTGFCFSGEANARFRMDKDLYSSRYYCLSAVIYIALDKVRFEAYLLSTSPFICCFLFRGFLIFFFDMFGYDWSSMHTAYWNSTYIMIVKVMASCIPKNDSYM